MSLSNLRSNNQSFGVLMFPRKTPLFQAPSLATCFPEFLKLRDHFLSPTLQVWGEPHFQRLLKMRSKSWILRVHICNYTNKGISCFSSHCSWVCTLFLWVPQIELSYFLRETHFHIWECICFVSLKCTGCTRFGYTVFRVHPSSWCCLNLGGSIFFLSSLIPR